MTHEIILLVYNKKSKYTQKEFFFFFFCTLYYALSEHKLKLKMQELSAAEMAIFGNSGCWLEHHLTF